MGIGEFIKAATERQKEKRTKRKEVRATRKKYGKQGREAAKKVRQGDLKGKDRRHALAASRVFHKVDNKGQVGGFAAFGKYSAKVVTKNKKREDRQEKRDLRKAKRQKVHAAIPGKPAADRMAERKARREARRNK
jgi:hypothetical protein